MILPGAVLVTGADQHQGLAVIRGLGRAGIPVIAAGSDPHSLGFASRYATVRRTYTSPFVSPARAQEDLLAIIRETVPALVIPAVEGTLVLLNEIRREVERYTILAAPDPEILECALDKGRTYELARSLGVPVPRTARGESVPRLLAEAKDFRFPVAVKPRGHALHPATANSVGFKSRYAESPEALQTLLFPFAAEGNALLVQEYVAGTGRCVAAVCDHGTPLALFAYSREREVPLSGGVSVLRKSLPLDDALRVLTTRLLGALEWHGIAMVEYKYDATTGRYTLIEINGRFQASTALSLSAGLNLPHLVAALYAGWPLPPIGPYRIGVRERWLRGDLSALLGAWRGGALPDRLSANGGTGRLAATWAFLRDFLPGVHYDEFAADDWRPALVELRSLVGELFRWIAGRSAPLIRRARPLVTPNRAQRASTHRSIRA